MAKQKKIQAKQKGQVKKRSDKQAEKFLFKVPDEYVFWCHDGTIFRDMQELANGLATMTDGVFAYHVTSEKNDFINWVRDVIKDEQLANELVLATDKPQATECVIARLSFLTSK
jgi:hypothetical protein